MTLLRQRHPVLDTYGVAELSRLSVKHFGHHRSTRKLLVYMAERLEESGEMFARLKKENDDLKVAVQSLQAQVESIIARSVSDGISSSKPKGSNGKGPTGSTSKPHKNRDKSSGSSRARADGD